MDRRVKERLIGASILVAIVVLVVPELLSGPKPVLPPASRPPVAAPETHRVVELDMATSKAPASSSEIAPSTLPPAASAAEPEPTAAVPTDAPPRAIVSQASPPPAAPAPAPVETSAPSPISTTRGWAVQLGSFERRDNAENLQRQLKTQGFSVYTSARGSGTAMRYRVRIGPLADRESAERIAARLKALGHVSSIVPPAA
jgi:DedD protein